MPDAYDFLSQILREMRGTARDAYRIANELNRDKMLDAGAAASISNILREIASVEVDLDLARQGPPKRRSPPPPPPPPQSETPFRIR